MSSQDAFDEANRHRPSRLCTQIDVQEMMSSQDAFDEALGMAGRALVAEGIAQQVLNVEQLAAMAKATSSSE
jgi:hypothetical protein